MSMSTHVIGFRPPNGKWKDLKKVWDACHSAGINPPKEVQEFFNYCVPDENGVEVKIPHKAYNAEMQDGFEIEVDKIPKDVKIIRFYNSY